MMLLLFLCCFVPKSDEGTIKDVAESVKKSRERYEAGGSWTIGLDWHGGNTPLEEVALLKNGDLRCMQLSFENRVELSCIGKETSFRLDKGDEDWYLVEHQEPGPFAVAESHWLMVREFAFSPVSFFGFTPIDELMTDSQFEVTDLGEVGNDVGVSFKLNSGHSLKSDLFLNNTADGTLSFLKVGDEFLFAGSAFSIHGKENTRTIEIALEYNDDQTPKLLNVKINQANSYEYTATFQGSSFEVPNERMFLPETYGVKYELKDVGDPEIVNRGSWIPTIALTIGICCLLLFFWKKVGASR